MEYLKALAELGVWLAVYPLGAGMLAMLGRDAIYLRSGAVLTLCVGSAIATLLLMLLALLGVFHPVWIGAAGWTYIAIWCSRRRSRQTPIRQSDWLQGLPLSGAFCLAVVLTAASVLYAFYPKESLLGERDEGIYAQHALHLMRTGSSVVDLHAMGLADQPEMKLIEQGLAPELPGIYPTGSRWTFQFSSATPVWMAALGAMLGPQGIFRFNALLGVLNCIAFYALTRRMLAPGQRAWAIAAVAVFAFQPSQIWVSRNTLSEPLCTWFVLNGLLAAVLALNRRSWSIGWLAGALIGMSGFVRIDAIVFSLAVSVACLFAALVNDSRREQSINPAMLATAYGCFTVAGMAMAYFGLWVQPYLVGLLDLVIVAILATGLFVVLARLLQVVPSLRMNAKSAHGAAWFAALAMLGLLVYAIWIRPHLSPFALIESKLVPQLNGQRDYRENSLLNVAAYLSWPVVIAGALGAAYALWSTLRCGLSPAKAWVAVFLLVPALVYLWRPMVSPDHIWASRRWLPTVFPACIVFAAIAAAWCSRYLRTAQVHAVVVIVTLGLSASLLARQRESLFLREDAGMVAQIGAIARQLPTDRVSYVVWSGPLTSALLTGFGSRVVPIAPGVQADWAGICRRIESLREQGCWVVHPRGMDIGPVEKVHVTDVSIKRLRRNAAMRALAHGTHVENSDWSITKVVP
ncbi:MAG: hypothetical protein ACREP7_21665 [Lysobacter sp.]